MISSYFLIPSAARAWSDGATWRAQAQRTTQRLGKVILPTAFYCLAAFAWSTVISPIPDVSLATHYWYTLGLEFIWVYAATVCMAPLFGLAKNRLDKKSYTAAIVAVGILVFIVNGYLAAQGLANAGEFSWLQKLMSAVTYVVAFLMGGLLRDHTESTGPLKARAVAKRTFTAVLTIAIGLEAALSATGNLSAMALLSYKSTSIVSYALAATSLLFAATRDNTSNHPRAANAIVTLSAATLGFYVMQSLTSSLWRPVFNAMLANILVGQNNSAPACVLVGIAISIAFALPPLLIDAARVQIVHKIKRQ